VEYIEDRGKLQANMMLEMKRSMVAVAMERAPALRPAPGVVGASSPPSSCLGPLSMVELLPWRCGGG
jgi:hypothetical protein